MKPRLVRFFVVFLAVFSLVTLIAAGCGEEQKPVSTTGVTSVSGPEGSTSTAPVSTEQTTSGGETYTINWVTAMQSTTPTFEWMQKWAAWMEKKSGGRLKFNFQPDETVLKAPELLDGVKNAVGDMSDIFLGLYSGRFPVTDVVYLPFLFEYPAGRALGATVTELAKKYPQIQAEFEAQGVKLLGFMPMGAGGQIHLTNKQVKTMADLKGVSLEAHGGDVLNEVLKALGATPASISPAEGYDALSKGIVGGMVGEYEFIMSSGFYELMKYSVEVGGLSFALEAVIMNLDFWNKLPADLQQLLVEEGMKAYCEVAGYIVDKNDMGFRTKLDEAEKAKGGGIYVLPAEERQQWKDIAVAKWDLWKGAAAATGAPADQILIDAQSLAKQFSYGSYATDYPEKVLAEWGM
ncbi:MAG: TRAP transporter substrate-binding protein DctP [Thermoleophilia bacterium]|nr:TRAP transporter substrate-binding protein DctP [Thermoleophilia bacterium]